MAFGKTKEEILKETFPGKSEQEIKEMIASFDSIKAKADKATELETKLGESNTELANTKVKLQELEAGRSGGGGNGGGGSGDGGNKNEPPRWDEDADAAFTHRATPIVAQNLQFQADMIYDRVTERLQREEPLFPVLKAEFDDMLKKSNLQSRATKDYVENCFNVVYGRHREEIRRDQAAGKGTFFVEVGRSQGGGNPPPPNKETQISEDERKEAAKFGVSPEQWIKTRNSIKFVGGGVIQP